MKHSFVMTSVRSNTAPSVSINDFTLGAKEWLRIGPSIQVSDSDGDTITKYQIWDTEGSQGLWLRGPGIIDASSGYEFSADALSDLWVLGNNTSGTETFQIQAFDGIDWGVKHSFVMTSVRSNTAPSVSINDFTLGAKEWLRIGPSIQVSDSDGDTITKYQIWDTEGSQGLWLRGPGIIDASSGYEFSADALSDLWVLGNNTSGTETFQIQAFDGIDWGVKHSFVMTSVRSNTAPSVSINDFTLGAKEWLRIGPSIQVSDSDGDTITKYQIWDTEGSQGLWLRGPGIIDASSGYEFSADALSGNNTSGTETFQIQAFDGIDWGVKHSFVMTSVRSNTAPSVSIK